MRTYSVWRHNYDDEWIERNYPGKCTTEFHQRYVSETGHEVSKEVLRKHISRDLDLTTQYHYTEEELAFVKSNYEKLGGKACAEALGNSSSFQYHKQRTGYLKYMVRWRNEERFILNDELLPST